MNGRGGIDYCIARYGVGGGMYGMSKVESIMLKYRPIAPKPVATGSGGTSPGDEYVKCGRSKRKYVRVNKSKKRKDNNFKRCGGGERKKVKASLLAVTIPDAPSVVTLPLLPETPDIKENKPVSYENNNLTGLFSDLVSPGQQETRNSGYENKKVVTPSPVWLCFDNKAQPPIRRPQVVSNVTVECVTDTWVEMEGCTDEERVKNMEKDTCPGFISDGQDKVVWTNKAYRQMVGVRHVADGEAITVVLVRKDKLTASTVTYPAFTCKVKVTYGVNVNSQQQAPSPSSPTLTLPCDVWRMGRGACAWRLDVKAALSLGR